MRGDPNIGFNIKGERRRGLKYLTSKFEILYPGYCHRESVKPQNNRREDLKAEAIFRLSILLIKKM